MTTTDFILDFPQCTDDVAEAGQLECRNQVQALVNELLVVDLACAAS
jgi:hypothetical protein